MLARVGPPAEKNSLRWFKARYAPICFQTTIFCGRTNFLCAFPHPNGISDFFGRGTFICRKIPKKFGQFFLLPKKAERFSRFVLQDVFLDQQQKLIGSGTVGQSAEGITRIGSGTDWRWPGRTPQGADLLRLIMENFSKLPFG